MHYHHGDAMHYHHGDNMHSSQKVPTVAPTLNSFDKFVNYLSESVATRTSRLSSLDAQVDMRIAAFQHSDRNQGRGRGRGRGHGRGRGGERGRGRGRFGKNYRFERGPEQSRYVDGVKIRNRKYSYSEYSNFTGAQ